MPKLQQLVSYIQGLHLIALALSEPGLKNLLHHIDALEGGIGDARGHTAPKGSILEKIYH